MKGSAANFRVKNTFIECEGEEANDASLLPEPASPGHSKWKTCPEIGAERPAASSAGTPDDEEEQEEEEQAEGMPLDNAEGAEEHPIILGKQFAPCKEDVKLDAQEDLGASTSTAARAPRVSFSTAGESEDLDASTSTAARARRVCFSATGESEEEAPMAHAVTTERDDDDLAPTPRAGRRFCGTEDLRERLLATEAKAAGGAPPPAADDDDDDADSAASPRRFRGFRRTEDLREESFADTTFKQRLAGHFGGERTAVWAQSLEKDAEEYTSTVADDASLPGQYPHMTEDHHGAQRSNMQFQQGHGAAHPAAGSAGSWFPGSRAAPSKLYLPTAACGARGSPSHQQAAGRGAQRNGGAPMSPTWPQGSVGGQQNRSQAMLYGAHRAEAPVSSAACLCMPFTATSGYGARHPAAGSGAQYQSMPTSRPVHTSGDSPTNNIYSTAVPVSFHAMVPRSYGSAAAPPPPPPMPPQAYGLAQMSACCMQYQQSVPAGGAPIPSMPHFIMGPGGQPQLAMQDLGSPVHAALPAPCAFPVHLAGNARMATAATSEDVTQATGFEGCSVANPRRASNRRLRLWAHIYLHMQVPGYDLVPRLIGRGGKNMRRIADETGAKLRIRGRGSGHFEIDGQFEAPTPLMVAVTTDKCDKEAFRLAISSTLKVLRRAEEEFTIFCKQRNIVHEGPAFSIGLLPEGAREVLAEILDGVPDADLGCSKRR